MANRHGGDFDPNSPPTQATTYTNGASREYPLTQSPVHQTPPQGAHMGTKPDEYVQVQTHEQPTVQVNGQPNHAQQMYQGVQQPRYQTTHGLEDQSRVNGQYSSRDQTVIRHQAPPLGTTTREVPASTRAEKEFPVNLKAWIHVFSTKTVYRWKRPHHFKRPGYAYQSLQTHRHRDWQGRITTGPYEDRYIHHYDGRLRKLIVACTDDIFDGSDTATWRRTYVRKVSPLSVRIATWVIDFSYEPESWEDWGIMLLRAFPAALAIQFLSWHVKAERWQFGGCYAPVNYQYWGDAKVWSNHLENRKGTSLYARNNEVYRVLKPRHLCFLRNPQDDEIHGVDVRSVVDRERTDGIDCNLSYLFVAYSTKQFSHDSRDDMIALHHIAETAARAAKVPAYWVAVSCMRDPAELENDVYRIADVLRGAQAMIIAVGGPRGKIAGRQTGTDFLLRQWGTRMWTFPEVLLSPGQQISVYTRGVRAPMILSKNQFTGRVWEDFDADESRQLVDHYLGNLGLSRLELAVTALKCLYNRQTTEHLSGDQAYALQGLLRTRPQVDSTDTAFQAFARLSLANDSDKLIERYMCTLPSSMDQSWYNMQDAYQSALWDIEPYCQVAGICEDDTIILDGAYGASIRWKSFFPVGWTTGRSWKRWFAIKAMENMTLLLIIMIVGFAVGIVALGVICLLLYIAIFLRTPMLIRTVYGGKFVGIQAAFFGFEGYLNAPTIERALFGGAFGRITWSTNGSPLSRSYINEFKERVGMDPTKDPEVRDKVEKAKHAKPGEMRVFTLVDTYNMQLTLFESVRPPVCLFFCASEGGMQRAVGCSYDWTTQSMYRETVLRMPTESLNRMDRVPRFRMGIQRSDMPSAPVRPASV